MHPYKDKHQDKAGHDRAKEITKGYARGGRANKVNVNIHLPPSRGEMPPVTPPLPGPPPMGTPSAPPMGVPPVRPPGGAGPFARGGSVKMTAGADSGIGRLEKATKAVKRGED